PFWLRRGAAWRVCARAGRWTVAGRGGLGVRVVVASCSRPKVEAAAAAFGRLLWPHQALQLEAVEAPSGVSAQPRGRQETRLGALNRLKAARSTAAGAAADFCIAFEGGVEADDTGRLVCFAVVCAQYRDDAYVSEVHSASHSLPPGLQAMMEQEGLELGVATDRFFEERIAAGYGKNTGGTIGALTHGIIDRVEFYTQPGMLALVPFMNAAAYGIVAGNPLDRPART
ncbi:unnamed protein product, partial [Prorocentrum cordatum]